MSSKFVHVGACVRTSSLWKRLSNRPLCRYTACSLPGHLPMDTWGGSHLLALARSAGANVGVQTSVRDPAFTGVAKPHGSPIFNFLRNHPCSSAGTDWAAWTTEIYFLAVPDAPRPRSGAGSPGSRREVSPRSGSPSASSRGRLIPVLLFLLMRTPVQLDFGSTLMAPCGVNYLLKGPVAKSHIGG